MEARLNIGKIQPEAFKAMYGLEKYLQASGLSKTHGELIKMRASQINGCAYCLNMHSRDARKSGETEQRLYLLNAWRETNLFTEEEKAILALTEQITLISTHVTDEVYNQAAPLFSDTYLAQIIMAVATINAWNRIAITARTPLD